MHNGYHFRVVIAIVALASSCSAFTLASDRDALDAIRLHWALPWPDRTVEPCSFTAPNTNPLFVGIVCDVSVFPFRIVQLVLDDSALVGPIPTAIAFLQALEELSLRNNPLIGGPIPDQLGSLSSIRVLELDNCGLTGSVPDALLDATTLSSLDLSENALSGSIPFDIHRLDSLQQLDLSRNNISGEIPISMAALTSLDSLQLFRNQIQGTIPSFFSTFSSLTVLILNDNLFTGYLPDLTSLPLDVFDVSNNQLYGDLALGAYNVDPGIPTVSLRNNGWVCPLPAWCAGFECTPCLPPGTFLGDEIAMNAIRAAYPSVIWPDALPSATDPCLNVGSFPNIVCDATNPAQQRIVQLEMTGQGLTGPMIPEFFALLKLQILLLDENSLSGSIPPHIGNITEIRAFSFRENQLTDVLPNEISMLPVIESINIASNFLIGEIPPSFNDLTTLLTLKLTNNTLEGSVPVLTNLMDLRILGLGRNLLTGNIPLTLSANQELTELDLSRNQLTGPIPDMMGQFPNIIVLLLSHNQLEGQMPNLGDKDTSFIDVSNNLLNGTVPSNLNDLQQLLNFDASDNLMTGDLRDTYLAINPLDLGRSYVFDLRNNLWDCFLPAYCTNGAVLPYDGRCEPCIPRPALTVLQPDLTVVLNGISTVRFGSTRLGTAVSMVFTVVSDGTGTLTVGHVEASNGAQFSVVDFSSFEIPYLSTRTFEVSLDANSVGLSSTQIQFTTDAPGNMLFEFTVEGTVTEPEVQVTGSVEIFDEGTSDFDDVIRYTPTTRVFTITNVGSGDLTINEPLATGMGAVTQTVGSTSLTGGSSTTFEVTIDTSALGPLVGSISFGNNDLSENPFNFDIVGRVVAPEVVVMEMTSMTVVQDDVTVIDFGTVLLGSPQTLTFQVRNGGTSALSINGLAVTDDFSVALDFGSIALVPGETVFFEIAADASILSIRNGQVSFASDDTDENPFTFAVVAEVVAPEVAVVELPGSFPVISGVSGVEFGDVLEGSPATKTFQVSNVGTSTLSISGLRVTGEFAIATDFGTISLAVSQIATFEVRIQAVTAGTSVGTVSFTTDDVSENPFTFIVRGFIIAPEVEVTQVPSNTVVLDGVTSVDYGDIVLGMLQTRTFQVRNSGTADLSISGLAVTDDFSVALDFGSVSLGPGETAAFEISADASMLATRNGRVSFTTDDTSEPIFDFEVLAEVIAPEIEVGQIPDGIAITSGLSTIDYGNIVLGSAQMKTFEIANSGTADLSVSGLNASGDFSIASPLSTTTVAPGFIATFSVTVDSSSDGVKSGLVVIENSDPDEDPFTFDVTAVVVSPEIQVTDTSTNLLIENGVSTISFGENLVSISPTKTFHIRNAGSSSLSINALTVYGTAFSVITGFGSESLPPGISTTFEVAMSGTSLGNFTGGVTFGTDDPEVPLFSFSLQGSVVAPEITVESLDSGTSLLSGVSTESFGSAVALGSPKILQYRIRNDGTSPLLVNPATIVGTGFSIPQNFLRQILAPSATLLFSIRMEASSVGTQTATISIVSDDTDEMTFTFGVEGTVVAPEIQVQVESTGVTINTVGSTVDFGDVLLAQSEEETVLITNDGTSDLILSGLAIHGISFSLSQGFSHSSVSPASVSSFRITAQGISLGYSTGQVMFESNDPDEPSFSFEVTINVVSPELRVFEKDTQQRLLSGIGDSSFGSFVRRGSISSRTFQVKNSGTAPLVVNGLIVQNGQFSILSDLNISSILPDEVGEFTILFSANTLGNQASIVSFTSNDLNEPTFFINVVANVVDAEVRVSQEHDASNIASGSSIILGNTLLSQPISRTFVISNDGTADLWLSNLASTDTQWLISSGFSATTLTPGQSRTFEVQLQATTVGATTTTISFNNDDLDENPFSFSLNAVVDTVEIEIVSLQDNEELISGTSEVNFGATAIFVPVVRTFDIQSMGTAALALTSISVGGDYTVENVNPALPTQIAPNGTARFEIRWNSQSGGASHELVSIVSNDVDENPFTFVVRGTANAPEVYVLDQYDGIQIIDDISEVSFGSVVPGVSVIRTFVVGNEGIGQLTLSNLVVGGSCFSLHSDLGQFSLNPGEFTVFSVLFQSDVPVSAHGTVAFNTNDNNEATFDFSLTAVVGAPIIDVREAIVGTVISGESTIDYGSVLELSAVDRVFTVENFGTVPLEIDNLRLNDASFGIGSNFGSNILNTGETTTFAIQSLGTRRGPVHADVEFDFNGLSGPTFIFEVIADVVYPEISVVDQYAGEELVDGLSTVQLGDIELGSDSERQFSIINSGTGMLNIRDVALTGSSGFSVVLPFPEVVQTLDYLSIGVSPDTLGTATATCTIRSNDADEDPFTFTITAEVVTPQLVVREVSSTNTVPNGGHVFLPDTLLGTFAIKHFEIQNSGTGMLRIADFRLSSMYFSIFSPLSHTVVGPGNSAFFAILYEADRPGSHSVEFSLDTNDLSQLTFRASIFARTITPLLQVEWLPSFTTVEHDDVVSLGRVRVNTSRVDVFRVTNVGDATLDLTSLRVHGDRFSIFSDFDEANVAPHGFTTFSISIRESQLGSYSDFVTFESNDIDNPLFSFRVDIMVVTPELTLLYESPSGTAVVSVGDVVDYGRVEFGHGSSGSFSVRNYGNDDLSVSALWIQDPMFSIGNDFSSRTVPPQEIVGFSVNFSSAASPGAHSTLVEFTSDDPDYHTFEFSILCTVVYPEISVREGRSQQLLVDDVSVVDFGNLPKDGNLEHSFIITNIGTGNLIVSNVTVESAKFSVRSPNGPSFTLGADESVTFFVVVSATTPGVYSSTVTIISSDVDEAQFTFDVVAALFDDSLPRFELRYDGSLVNPQDTVVLTNVERSGVLPFEITNSGLGKLDLFSLETGPTLIVENEFGSNFLLFEEATDFRLRYPAFVRNEVQQVTIRHSDSSLDPFVFYVQLPPSAQCSFSLKGDFLTIYFDALPSYVADDCASYFTLSTVAQFGLDPKCRMLQDTATMTVFLGEGASMDANSLLQFNPTIEGYIIRPIACHVETIEPPPPIKLVPNAYIIGRCNSLSISVENINDMRLTYDWRIIGHSGLSESERALIEHRLSTAQDSVSFGPSELTPDVTYVFQVVVTTFSGFQLTDEVSIRKTSDFVLDVEIVGDSPRRINTTSDNIVYTTISFDDSCRKRDLSGEVDVTYQWLLTLSPRGIPVIGEYRTDQPFLSIPAGLLEPAEVYVATVAATARGITDTDTVVLETAPEKSKCPIIVGGDRLVPFTNLLYFDARMSTDIELTYTWRCRRRPDFEPCRALNGELIFYGDFTVLCIGAAVLEEGEYEFTVVIRDPEGAVVGKDVVKVIVSTDPRSTPLLSMKCDCDQRHPHEFTFSGRCDFIGHEASLNMYWIPENAFKNETDFDGTESALRIRREDLFLSDYDISDVRLVCEWDGMQVSEPAQACGPLSVTKGDLKTDSVDCDELDQLPVSRLRARNFNGGCEKLHYHYTHVLEDRTEFPLSIFFTEEDSVAVPIPLVSESEAVVAVYALDCELNQIETQYLPNLSRVESTVDVCIPSCRLLASVWEDTKDKIEYSIEEGNVAKAHLLMSSMLPYLNRCSDDDDLDETVRGATFTFLADLAHTVEDCQYPFPRWQAFILEQLTARHFDVISKHITDLQTIIDRLLRCNYLMDTTLLNIFMTESNTLRALEKEKSGYSSEYRRLRNQVSSVLTLRASSRRCGDTLDDFRSDVIQTASALADTDNLNSMQLSVVELPRRVKNAFGGSLCGNVDVVEFTFAPYPARLRETVQSSVVSVELRSISGELIRDASEFRRSAVVRPQRLKPGDDDDQYTCVFFDEGTHNWSSRGVTLQGESEKSFSCATDHFTTFAVLLDPASSGGNGQNSSSNYFDTMQLVLQIVGSSLIVLFVLLAIIIIVVFERRPDWRKKFFAGPGSIHKLTSRAHRRKEDRRNTVLAQWDQVRVEPGAECYFDGER